MFSNLRGNDLFGDCVQKLVARAYVCSGTFLDGPVNVSKVCEVDWTAIYFILENCFERNSDSFIVEI